MTREQAEIQNPFERNTSIIRRRLDAIAADTSLSEKDRLDILRHELEVFLKELKIAHEELLRDITERKAAEDLLQLQKTLLAEQIKEMHCLYEIARVIEAGAPFEQTLKDIVEQIPSGWQYSHSACARIRVGDIECATPNFVDRQWKQASEIHAHGRPVGSLEVCYLSAKPDADEGPFLTDERHLLDIIAARIGSYIERIWAEEALRESNARNQLLVENLSEGIWIVDEHAVTTFVNEQMARMLGYRAEGLIGKPLQDFLPGERRSQIPEHMERRKRGLREKKEQIFLHKDGSRIVTLMITSPIFDVNGAFAGAIAGIMDITERKRIEEALMEASRKLNLLSSITRHDILNQVTALKAFLQLVEERHCEDPESMEMFGKLKTITDTIRRQITFTGDYQHMGEREPAWQQVNWVVKRAAESVMLGGATLTVTTGALEVFADPMLEKAFYNLLDNAVVHGDDVTAIGVSCFKEGNNCVIVVEDDGTGIPAAMKDAIFERGVGRITGYGLFLTREILAITDMVIKETGEEGKGARFEITVPGYRWRMAGSPP